MNKKQITSISAAAVFAFAMVFGGCMKNEAAESVDVSVEIDAANDKNSVMSRCHTGNCGDLSVYKNPVQESKSAEFGYKDHYSAAELIIRYEAAVSNGDEKSRQQWTDALYRCGERGDRAALKWILEVMPRVDSLKFAMPKMEKLLRERLMASDSAENAYALGQFLIGYMPGEMPQEGIALIDRAAESGYEPAVGTSAVIHFRMETGRKREGALKKLREAAFSGHREAALELMSHYHYIWQEKNTAENRKRTAEAIFELAEVIPGEKMTCRVLDVITGTGDVFQRDRARKLMTKCENGNYPNLRRKENPVSVP